MFFTLFDAMTAKYLLELNKNGNTFVVILWDKRTPEDIKEITRFETKRYYEAEGIFNLYAKRYNLSHMVKKVDNTDVYNYIESQHD